MICIFKTSVKNKKDIRKLKPYLNGLLPGGQWNFDLEDCDKILRVESQDPLSQSLIGLLAEMGFDCVELQ